MSELPIACDLTAFTPEQRQRHIDLGRRLEQAVQEVQELADGYAFRYTPHDTLWSDAAEYVDLERRCCPFFTFTLKREVGGDVWLLLTGSEDVKAFLATQLPAG